MSQTAVMVTDSGEQTPLLQNSSPPTNFTVGSGENSLSSSFSVPLQSAEVEHPPPPHSTATRKRLVSLDILRGLTVALMILVDDAGGVLPSINHSPWFGVTIADFVMPFFLFGVGVSASLVFQQVSSKRAATIKVIVRTIKLFLLGLILQGGYFHGRSHLTYGVDVSRIRWMGVLQRISIGYLLTSILEIWFVRNIAVDSAMAFGKRYCIQWVVAIVLVSLYMSLLYGLYVPDWTFEVSRANFDSSLSAYGSGTKYVNCRTRGSLEPPCNAVGFIDRLILGEHHLYKRPVYRRAKECSVNSPDYGSLPPHAPSWCLAPFDPEGILSSLMAAVTCFVGLHFGHIVVHFKDHVDRIILWSISSFLVLFSGYVLEVLGVPLSKPLYTLSYMCITAGGSGFLLTIIYYIVDVKQIRKPMVVLEWMGMNALIIYSLAARDIFPGTVQGFYWHSPENNLVDGTESLLRAMFCSKEWGTFALVMLEILFWGLVAGFLHMKRVYIRL